MNYEYSFKKDRCFRVIFTYKKGPENMSFGASIS